MLGNSNKVEGAILVGGGGGENNSANQTNICPAVNFNSEKVVVGWQGLHLYVPCRSVCDRCRRAGCPPVQNVPPDILP